MPSKWCPLKTRKLTYARDGFRCVYCERHQSEGIVLSLDHVEARAKGGALTDPANLVTACVSCNSLKRDLSVAQFQRFLRVRTGKSQAGLLARVRAAVAKPLGGVN